MRIAAKVLSYVGLGLTLVPSFLVFYGQIDWSLHAHLMLAGMFLWFIFAVSGLRIRKN